MSSEVEKLIPGQDLKECAICARLFTSDRVNIHEAICQKSSTIQRKSFDISEQRTRGTEAERLSRTAAKNEYLLMLQKNGPCGLLTNWRGKHDDFMKTVNNDKRRASEKNRSVSDLPFPPPLGPTDSDHVQCQRCLRSLHAHSALRHVAKCPGRTHGASRDV